ncbi:hypothetical protein [Natronomonas marina]|uniref:hypothetical protein n=1 Tax=Natronomonas marina TaxID=2961939 RepID=UPI0020C9862A|nr:hypothetical protein [Natronomonas marina]
MSALEMAGTRRRLYVAELCALVLVPLDILLTQLVAVEGPAVEVGLGAVRWLSLGGWPALFAAQVVAVSVGFGAARLVGRVDAGLGHQVRGLVVGFWLFTVSSNAAIAVHTGVISL